MHFVLALLLLTPLGVGDDARFNAAEQLYREVEFERATIKFQELALDNNLSSSERAGIFIWIGMCHAQLGDFDSARDALAQAVKLDAGVAPPSAAPPSIKELLEEVRAAAPSPPPPPDEVVATPPAVEEGPAPEPIVDTPPNEGGGLVPTLGWIAAGAGGVALIGAAVVGSLGLANVALSYDENTTQRDADAAGELANAEFWAAGVQAVIGVALISTGAAVALLAGE